MLCFSLTQILMDTLGTSMNISRWIMKREKAGTSLRISFNGQKSSFESCYSTETTGLWRTRGIFNLRNTYDLAVFDSHSVTIHRTR